ncbi:receptor-type tyrosine-protein phosphatase eta-like [Mantella aurantiaca]
MTGVTKSYNINYYWNASFPNTTSNSTNVTLSSLKSGSNYTVAVVTVGVRGYQSTAVSRSVFTKPLSVKSPQSYNATATSVFLNWNKPDEYQSSYSYRVQTNVTSPSTLINNTIVTNESATIVSLTPGETYTFLVYTRAADNVTESDPVSLTTCTVPGQAVGVTVNNSNSVNSLAVIWTAPAGKASYYNVTITGDVTNTTQTNTTQANFTGLSPGRNYTVTVQTVSGSCSSAITTVTEATYPSPPENITFVTVGTNTITLSWGEPVNMTGVTKSYNINYYWNASSPNTTTSNSTNVTLLSLRSGSNYTVTVVTVGVGGYQSTPVSRSVFTIPGQAVGVTVNNYKSVNSLAVNWTTPAGKVSYYNVTITGDVNNTKQTNVTQANFTNLLPGRNYTVTVQTVSGSCSSAIITVTEATYPSPPGNITFITTGTNTTMLSWGEPVNMTGVTKSYSINYYWNASSPNTTSNSTNVTLLSLKSGSNYTVTVVTVGVRGYQSTPVSRSVFTKPLSVKSPQSYYVTTTSVSLNWSKPDEYQSSYSYRVQTNVTSSSTLINNTIVTNESATIVSLMPGETYTFLVYTRAADNVTESDPVSLTTCTVPGQAVGVTVDSYKSVNSLVVNWMTPAGKVSYYNVTITGDVTNTIQTNTTQANFTNLLPGRNYTVTVQTFSGSCSSAIITVTEATYPSPPGYITFITIGTNTTTLSWGEPVNMTGVTKSYNINYYWNASSPNTTTSNSANVTLLSLKSGSNYTIAVVTVGVRGYQSTPVSRSVFTKPFSVKSPQFYNVTSSSVSLNWSKPDEYQSSYSYRVQTNVTSPSTLINNTIVTNESATIVSLTPGETYTFLVYTRAADNVTESDPVSLTTCTVPGQAVGVTVSNFKSVNSLVVNWTAPAGKVSYYNVTITGDVNNTIQTNTTQANFTGLSPGRNYTVTVQTVSGSCSSAIITVTEATCEYDPHVICVICV